MFHLGGVDQWKKITDVGCIRIVFYMISFSLGLSSHSVGGYGVRGLRAGWLRFLSEKF
jgi:hypothetical protein